MIERIAYLGFRVDPSSQVGIIPIGIKELQKKENTIEPLFVNRSLHSNPIIDNIATFFHTFT